MITSLKEFLDLLIKLLNYLEYEHGEGKNYEECDNEGRQEHIYLIIKKLRGQAEIWQDYYAKGYRFLILRKLEIRKEKE